MRKFSEKSLNKLNQCHPDLQRLFNRVIEVVDCTVICGHRSKLEQDEAVRGGFSKTPWPKSKHNTIPSMAVDVAPYPIKWENKVGFYHFAGIVRGIAEELKIKIRWGGDWDRDMDLLDQNFFDLPHFELIE